MPDRVTIPTTLLQEIVRYLATRPLGDVLALYQAIQTEAKPVEPPPPAEPLPVEC